MAELAGAQLRRAIGAFASRDLAAAHQVEHDDDAIDDLNVQVFKATLDLGGSPSEREQAYRQLLIARSLERIGDNAVDIAEQAAFLQTRELRQFTDASTPGKRRDPGS